MANRASDHPSEYVLRAEGVGKSFGSVEALKAASLWAEAGKVTTLLGRNGAGKTTLMKIAAGVLRADYGVVALFGDAKENHSLHRLARSGLMYVPQEQLVSPAYRVRDHLKALATTFGSAGIDGAISEMRIETPPVKDWRPFLKIGIDRFVMIFRSPDLAECLYLNGGSLVKGYTDYVS